MTRVIQEKSSNVTVGVVVFEAPDLGDRSYLLFDEDVAIVIDAQRLPDPYLKCAVELGVEITHIFETHIHNDYVSGGLALSRRSHARYVIPFGEDVGFSAECHTIHDRQSVSTGSLRITALATPGHSLHHLAYLVGSDEGGKAVVLTGGSLLSGTTGRTDLFGAELTAELTTAQWTSVRNLLETLPSETNVLPTHGFGSFCAAIPNVDGTDEAPTIGLEREQNPAARLELDQFVQALTADPPPIPAYYAHIGPLNRVGQDSPHLGEVTLLTNEGVDLLLTDRSWVVDLRERRRFAASHVPGTVNIELGANLATYLGWIVPFELPFTLIADSSDAILDAQRMLSQIGRESILASALTEIVLRREPDQIASYQVASFKDLALEVHAAGFPTVVDVRHKSEWRQGHLLGALHIPLPELPGSLPQLQAAGVVWIHCAAGFRAAIGASILDAQGLQPVLIDDQYANASLAGLTVQTELSSTTLGEFIEPSPLHDTKTIPISKIDT